MTPSNHAELMKKLYKLLGVAPSEVTHELRVFAAQAMYEMGVSPQARQACRTACRVQQLAM
jgi:hypothetical protein